MFSVPAPTKSEVKAPKRPQHRKLYVQVKGTEDMIEIDVDKNRPKNFASKEEANDWEEKTLRDILRFKKLVEDGKFVPEEVVQRLQAKGQLISKCPFAVFKPTKKPPKIL